MADILEIVNNKFCFELTNYICKYLGTSPSAKIIKGCIKQLDEIDREDFFTKWQVIKFCHSLLYTKPISIINVERCLYYCSNLDCKECGIECETLQLYIENDCKCHWCHSKNFREEEFYNCDDCNELTTIFGRFHNTSNGLFCGSCMETRDENGELETESESEIEDEFWEEN
jgi:hypothetical protein